MDQRTQEQLYLQNAHNKYPPFYKSLYPILKLWSLMIHLLKELISANMSTLLFQSLNDLPLLTLAKRILPALIHHKFL